MEVLTHYVLIGSVITITLVSLLILLQKFKKNHVVQEHEQLKEQSDTKTLIITDIPVAKLKLTTKEEESIMEKETLTQIDIDTRLAAIQNRTWMHAVQQDTATQEVYIYSPIDWPISHGRTFVRFESTGICFIIAPTIKGQQEGTWHMTGTGDIVYYNQSPENGILMQIESVDEKQMIVKK